MSSVDCLLSPEAVIINVIQLTQDFEMEQTDKDVCTCIVVIKIRYILNIICWINLPATVEASFFKLLKLSAPNWFKIPGNISAISAKIKITIF